jgi:hypothetical protein
MGIDNHSTAAVSQRAVHEWTARCAAELVSRDPSLPRQVAQDLARQMSELHLWRFESPTEAIRAVLGPLPTAEETVQAQLHGREASAALDAPPERYPGTAARLRDELKA